MSAISEFADRTWLCAGCRTMQPESAQAYGGSYCLKCINSAIAEQHFIPNLIAFPHPVPSEANEVRCSECKCWTAPSLLDRLGLCPACVRTYYA